MFGKYHIPIFSTKNPFSILLFLILLTYSIFPKETIYEEIDYIDSSPCSQSKINRVLKELKNSYEEKFAFLSHRRKISNFSPYFYFVLRCISVKKLSDEIKNTSYAFQRTLLFLKHKYIVESHLKKCIDPVDYNFGHYYGQHTRIWKLPNKRWVFLILKEIITNPEYPFLTRGIDKIYYKAIRIMAVDALSETTYNRKKVISFLKRLVSIKRYKDGIENIDLYDLTHPALISLGILGEKEFVNQYINHFHSLAFSYLFEGHPPLYYHIFSQLVDLYVYNREYNTALHYFRQLLNFGDKIIFYNVACLLSLMGKKKQALRMLKRAIKAGYDDLRWLKKDKELDPIRNTKTFKLILKHLERKLRER